MIDQLQITCHSHFHKDADQLRIGSLPPLLFVELQKALLQLFLQNFPEITVFRLSGAAKEELLGYDYPGNVRELISVVQRAAILSEGDEILPKDLFLQARSKK